MKKATKVTTAESINLVEPSIQTMIEGYNQLTTEQKMKLADSIRAEAEKELHKQREQLAAALKTVDALLGVKAETAHSGNLSVKEKILSVLNSGKELSRPEIQADIERQWGKPNNLYTMIDKLLAENKITVSGKGRQARYKKS
jgi:superoxide dismutase